MSAAQYRKEARHPRPGEVVFSAVTDQARVPDPLQLAAQHRLPRLPRPALRQVVQVHLPPQHSVQALQE